MLKNIIIGFLNGIKIGGIIIIISAFYLIGLSFISKISNNNNTLEIILLILFLSGFIGIFIQILV